MKKIFQKKSKYTITPFYTIIRNNILLNKQLVYYYDDNSIISIYAYSIFPPNNVENTPLLNHFGQHIYNMEMNIPEQILNTNEE